MPFTSFQTLFPSLLPHLIFSVVCQVGLADVTQWTWVSSLAEVRKDRACLELTLSSDSGSVGVNFQNFTSNFQKPLFQVTESKNTPWAEKSQKPLSLGAGPGAHRRCPGRALTPRPVLLCKTRQAQMDAQFRQLRPSWASPQFGRVRCHRSWILRTSKTSGRQGSRAGKQLLVVHTHGRLMFIVLVCLWLQARWPLLFPSHA